MNAVLKKLGLKDQNPVLIINAPEEYKEVMKDIEANIHTSPAEKYKFIQVFAKTMDEANKLIPSAIETLEEGGHFWLCYPKGTSKKYKSDINRDKSFVIFAPFEFEPVSLVAIDVDWSALRFKAVEEISVMKRKTASTEKGKERIK